MDIPPVSERQIQAEVEELREKFPQTQDLYREVCTVLFFRYGITPTANKLYQLVRKGSMTAPAEALNRFWENLREKSRVRIEHPDLPEEIKSAAGELAASLWTLAQNKAVESLREYEAEARASVLEANTVRVSAEAARDAIQATLEKTQQELDETRNTVSALRQQLAAEGATREALEEQLTKARADIAAHQQANESARHYFAAELEKMRTAAQLADERFHASEKRALMEIDRERSAVIRIQKELEGARLEANKAAERNRAETAELQQQLGDLRQKFGSLEGQTQILSASRDQIEQERKALQIQASASASEVVSLQSEIRGLQRKVEDADHVIRTLKEKQADAQMEKQALSAAGRKSKRATALE